MRTRQGSRAAAGPERDHLQVHLESGVNFTCVAAYYLWWIVWLIFFLSFFVFALFLRMAIRRKYGIREECCTCTGVDGFEDACCAMDNAPGEDAR